MEELMSDVDDLHTAMGDVKQQLKAIQHGCELLSKSDAAISKSNSELSSRVDSLANIIATQSQTLTRLETFMRAEKASGKKIQEDFPHTSTSQSDDHLLGYRGMRSALENRRGLLKKIELPVFDGRYPSIWLNRAERYFRLGSYNDMERFDLISVSFEGPILNWFNVEWEEDPFRDWEHFRQRLVARFTQRLEDDPAKRLFAITQKGSITDYINEFEELRSLVKGIDERNLEHVFYNGLKPEMEEVIKVKEPQGLRQHIAAVIKMEDSAFCKSVAAVAQTTTASRSNNYVPLKSASLYNSGRNTYNPQQSNTQLIEKAVGKPQRQLNTPAPRRLSPAEVAEKRRLGLCFKCDQKWSKTHDCKNVELKVLTVLEEQEVEVWNEELCDTFEDENGVVTELMELSMQSFLGLSSPKTTKLWGHIGKEAIVVMLDSGATHNFLDHSVVSRLNLPVTRSKMLRTGPKTPLRYDDVDGLKLGDSSVVVHCRHKDGYNSTRG